MFGKETQYADVFIMKVKESQEPDEPIVYLVLTTGFFKSNGCFRAILTLGSSILVLIHSKCKLTILLYM